MNKKKVIQTEVNEPDKLDELSREKFNCKVEGGGVHQRIIDLLDMQVLIAVIVFIVPGWLYMNNAISSFTGSEPYNLRMANIYVHYILTAVIVLCIAVTYVKGKYLLKTDVDDFTTGEKKYIDLLIYGWVYALVLSVLLIVIANVFPNLSWRYGAIFGLAFLIGYMVYKQFEWVELIIINVMLVILFPIFISIMTNITHDIELGYQYDRETDNLMITVAPRSYDAEYYVKGLADNNLVNGEQYNVYKHAIYTKVAYVKSNQITVSTISPASGENFFLYGLAKILNIRMDNQIPENSFVYNKSIIVNVE